MAVALVPMLLPHWSKKSQATITCQTGYGLLLIKGIEA
jgi:hypothetical protein